MPVPTGGFLGPWSQAGPAGMVCVPELCPLAVWGVRCKEGCASELQMEPKAAMVERLSWSQLGRTQAGREEATGAQLEQRPRGRRGKSKFSPWGSEESGPCTFM